MIKFVTGLILFLMYLGALSIYPFLTFIILMNKWGNWINVEIKELLENV